MSHRNIVIIYRSSKRDGAVELHYVEETLRKAQARFDDRRVLTPQIDLEAFQCRAVVDWIDIHIRLDRPSQHWWINERIEGAHGRKAFVEPAGAGSGGATAEFRIRLQEPKFQAVRTLLSNLEDAYGFAAAPSIVGIEVSIDFYPRVPGEDDRARMHGVLVRHFFPTTRVLRTNRTWPRFMPGLTKDTDYTVSRNEKDESLDLGARMSPGMDQAPCYGSTYYVGERNDPRAFWRIQNKVIDRQNIAAGTFEELSDAEKRIRIEVTLGDHDCREIGLCTFEDLRTLKFTNLQKRFFQFMKPTFAIIRPGSAGVASMAVRQKVEDFRRQRFLNAGVLGLQIREDARRELRHANLPTIKRRHRLLGSKMPPTNRTGAGDYGTMVAYEELSRMVERALAELQRRVRGEMGV